MGEVKGKLVTCDRCGTTIFLKLFGSEIFDGGFTQQDKFEEAPAGWELCASDEKGKYCRLCPSCYEEFTKLLTVFYGRCADT